MDSKVDQALLSKIPVVFIGTHENGTSRMAQVVIPSLTEFRKIWNFCEPWFLCPSFQSGGSWPSRGFAGLEYTVNRILNGLVKDYEQSANILRYGKKCPGYEILFLKGLSFSQLKKEPFYWTVPSGLSYLC